MQVTQLEKCVLVPGQNKSIQYRLKHPVLKEPISTGRYYRPILNFFVSTMFVVFFFIFLFFSHFLSFFIPQRSASQISVSQTHILQESEQSQDFITQESRSYLTSHKDHKTTQQLRHFISLFSQDYKRITKCSQDFISRCHSADIDSLSPISNSKKALFLFCCFLADCSFTLTRGIKTHRSGCTGCTIQS